MQPHTSADFDRAYRQPFTFWGDVRIPPEIKVLVARPDAHRVLELGCGVGRFSRWAAGQGKRVVGVDFSPVAIEKARRVPSSAELRVGDVTKLEGVEGPFDVSFDVGCFHCLDAAGQRAYAGEVARLLRPRGVHLIWALDHSPSDMRFGPELVKKVFAPDFDVTKSEPSRRRIVRSHWYWLERR